MAEKGDETMQKIGGWAFIVGIVIAVLAGIVPESMVPAYWVIVLLAVLGLIVGFLNVTAKESTPFLVAAIALVLSTSTFNAIMMQVLGTGTVTTAIGKMLGNVGIFVAPAAVLVALRAIFALASAE